MVLNPQTQTYVDIVNDLTVKNNTGEVTLDNLDQYLRSTYDVSEEEYRQATDEANKNVDAYIEYKKEFEDSPFSFLGIASERIPAHIREQELSTFQQILDLPTRAAAGIPKAVSESLLGEAVGTAVKSVTPGNVEIKFPESLGIDPINLKNIVQDIDESLATGEYTKELYKTIQETFDPAQTGLEKAASQILTVAIPGEAAARKLRKANLDPFVGKKAADVIKSTGRFTTFAASDVLLSNKEESLANAIIQAYPDSPEWLERLAIDPDDSFGTVAAKKAVEALGLGVAAEGIGLVLGAGYKRLKNKKQAIDEDIIKPVIDEDAGKIKDTTITQSPTGKYQQKVTIEQPIDILIEPTDVAAKKPGFISKWLGSRMGIDKKTYDAFAAKDSSLRASKSEAQLQAKELEGAIRADFGKPINKLGDEDIYNIRTALGKSPDPSDMPKDIKKIYSKNPAKRSTAETKKLDAYGDSAFAAAREEQKEALKLLPENTQQAIKNTRVIIDDYTKEIQKYTGAADIDVTLDKNLGLYTNTTYEIFTNPEYRKKIKDTFKGKMNDAEASQVLEGMRKYLSSHIKVTDEAIRPLEVENKLGELVEKLTDNDEDFFKKLTEINTKLDEKSINPNFGKILSKRVDIPLPVKNFLKATTDPLTITEQTIKKQADLLTEFRFIDDIKNIADSAYGQKLFSSVKDVKGDYAEDLGSLASDYITKLGPKANPLAEIYTSKSYKKTLQEGLNPEGSDKSILRGLKFYNYLNSAGATVLSQPTHLINLKGNVIFTIANGNFIQAFKSIPKLYKSTPKIKRLLGESEKSIKVSKEELKKLQQYGLLDNSVTAEFLEKTFKDVIKNSDEGNLSFIKKYLLKPVDKAVEPFKKLYRAEDTYFKVLNYYSELDKYSKAFPKASLDQVENLAKDVVLDTLPTYSRIPRLLKSAQQNVPLIGVFPSFLAESFRVAKNTPIIALRDFTTGLRTGNMELAKIGGKRLAAFSAVAYAGYSELLANKSENLISDNDENVINILSQIYDRNSSREFITPIQENPRTGMIETQFFNTGAVNPQESIIKVGRAVQNLIFSGQLNPDTLKEFGENISEVFGSFTALSLGTEKLLNILTGIDSTTGKKIRSEDNTLAENIINTGKELVPGIGTAKAISDIVEAMDSEDRLSEGVAKDGKFEVGRSKSGFPLRPSDKAARFLGQRKITFSLDKSLQYKVGELSRSINSSNKKINTILTRAYNTGLARTPKGKEAILEEVNQAVLESYNKQQKLADLLHNVKKVMYTDKDGVRRQINDKKIQLMLSEKGRFPFKEDINKALARTGENFIGSFKPPSLSQKAMARLSQQLGKINPTLLMQVREILDRNNGAPLLELQNSSGKM